MKREFLHFVTVQKE
uniref:Uncharacterized protein n=1 Tax=Arundo donax TaxID=35708 RepID=A0A0A9EZB1_ARUDO